MNKLNENSTSPKVAVLLPTYQGARYLRSQIDSILSQVDVQVHVFCHDDGSDDASIEIITSYENKVTIIDGAPTGGAAQNFFFLLLNAPIHQFDYVALSDQDDIWLDNKLSRGISTLAETGADAYSSDILAFWQDGKQKYITKSQRQTQFDYFFEAGGPGNTHIFPYPTADNIRRFVSGLDESTASRIELHDWLFYAYCRESGLRWHIDPFASLLYRQHSSNVMGAAVGFPALVARIKLSFSGWYIGQVLLVAKAIGSSPPPMLRAEGSKGEKCIHTLLNFWKLRRKLSHSIFASIVLCYHHIFNGSKFSE